MQNEIKKMSTLIYENKPNLKIVRLQKNVCVDGPYSFVPNFVMKVHLETHFK